MACRNTCLLLHCKLHKHINDLESETEKLSPVTDKQDEQARRQTMMLFSVKEKDRETWDITDWKIIYLLETKIVIFNTKSNIKLHINRAQHVGQLDLNETRPILVLIS